MESVTRVPLRRLIECVAVAATLVASTSARAEDDWRASLKHAETADIRHDYREAANAYKASLAAMPATEENVRAKTLASLAQVLFEMRQYEAASLYGCNAVNIAKRLQVQNKLDPAVLEELHLLDDTCQQIGGSGLPVGVPNAGRAIVAVTQLGIPLAQIFHPDQGKTFGSRLIAAQQPAAQKNYPAAEKLLQKLLQSCDPQSDNAMTVRVYIAVVQAKQGHSEAIDKVLKELTKKYSQATAWRRIGEGRYWTYDWDGSIDAFNHARSALAKPNKDWQEEGKINDDLANAYMSKSGWTVGELYWRRNIEFYSKYPQARRQLRECQSMLAICLRHLKRYKEADQVQPRYDSSSDYEFLLTDEERAAMARAKKSNSATAKP